MSLAFGASAVHAQTANPELGRTPIEILGLQNLDLSKMTKSELSAAAVAARKKLVTQYHPDTQTQMDREYATKIMAKINSAVDDLKGDAGDTLIREAKETAARPPNTRTNFGANPTPKAAAERPTPYTRYTAPTAASPANTAYQHDYETMRSGLDAMKRNEAMNTMPKRVRALNELIQKRPLRAGEMDAVLNFVFRDKDTLFSPVVPPQDRAQLAQAVQTGADPATEREVMEALLGKTKSQRDYYDVLGSLYKAKRDGLKSGQSPKDLQNFWSDIEKRSAWSQPPRAEYRQASAQALYRDMIDSFTDPTRSASSGLTDAAQREAVKPLLERSGLYANGESADVLAKFLEQERFPGLRADVIKNVEASLANFTKNPNVQGVQFASRFANSAMNEPELQTKARLCVDAQVARDSSLAGVAKEEAKSAKRTPTNESNFEAKSPGGFAACFRDLFRR